MNPNTDKLIRRSAIASTVVASYLLLTADYGPQPNVLDPIKKKILSAQRSTKEFILGSKKKPEGPEGSDTANMKSDNTSK